MSKVILVVANRGRLLMSDYPSVLDERDDTAESGYTNIQVTTMITVPCLGLFSVPNCLNHLSSETTHRLCCAHEDSREPSYSFEREPQHHHLWAAS